MNEQPRLETLEDLRTCVFVLKKVPYFITRTQGVTTTHVVDKDGYHVFMQTSNEFVKMSSKIFEEITKDDLAFLRENIARVTSEKKEAA